MLWRLCARTSAPEETFTFETSFFQGATVHLCPILGVPIVHLDGKFSRRQICVKRQVLTEISHPTRRPGFFNHIDDDIFNPLHALWVTQVEQSKGDSRF